MWWGGNLDYDDYSYEDWGRYEAEGLRYQTLTWDQLIAFIQQEVLVAPAGDRNDFRRGFLGGYGKGGISVFVRLMDESWATVHPPSVRP